MTLDKILDFLSRLVDFFMGFLSGYSLGSKKKVELENELIKKELEKKHLENVNKVNDGRSDDDILRDLLGRK